MCRNAATSWHCCVAACGHRVALVCLVCLCVGCHMCEVFMSVTGVQVFMDVTGVQVFMCVTGVQVCS